ncbi:NfeD family protein [Leptospira wolffii]|uniref:NfeD family protein n=1 Tax=Leptospira wolffii TaxID=409998 RepID=A0A2M9Z6S2_9LEPT|nr:NfeD family protein [Leptospira wolffii]EPG67194.1 nodulation efficiency protein NfeD [Leptospira wolffii serovar Khorat str. Khorat-H2]PJZ64133.1 NfeD family protein [Leptospira wolffii]TGL53935.1 NfeD family protein [Leptospira wolffii]
MDFFQDGHNIAYLWIGTGLVLMVAELFIPGTFVVFLGLSALIVGGLTYFLELGIWTQAAIWASLSGILILIGGAFLRKFFPSASEKAILNPEDGPGRIVPVTKDILVERKGGRILFQGTEWDAISKTKRIGSGKKVRIIERENLTFIVEPLDFPEEV